jgi:hypothetical protein
VLDFVAGTMFPSFCRITGHSRNLPRANYFPILPPISPAEAKRFRTTSCRITCNFNPNHNYQPITKLIDEGVVKCRITEKSVYEYKFFLQPCFEESTDSGAGGGAGPGFGSVGGTESEKRSGDEFYYYEIDDKVLVLPKSVERELNKGIIRDVQISVENNKIGFKYLNRIKEYDLVSESTDKLQELAPLKGKGLRKPARKKRKKSALLGDLKSVFEEKEKLAEIAVKKAMEKIQPDTSKMELVKSKIISSKAPVFGYVDHNNKFTELSDTAELPKHVTKGQMQNGVFTPGEFINDTFLPGKYIDNTFTPGIIKDNEFVPGSFIEKEVNGKPVKKFIPGKVITGVFTPGQMIKTSDGSKSEFVPGQVLTLENNEKKFVPGLLIEHVENDVMDLKFVPGSVEETNNTIKFTPGELIETNEGLKFICEKINTEGSFEIQTFDNTYDFDIEDVKAATHVCDTLLDLVRPDTTQSSFDIIEEDFSVSTLSGQLECLRQGSKQLETILSQADFRELQATQTMEAVSQALQDQAFQVINQICSTMNLSEEESEQITEKFLEEFLKQNLSEGLSITNSGAPGVSLLEQVCQNASDKTSSLVKQVFSELGIVNQSTELMDKVIKDFVNAEVKEVALSQIATNLPVPVSVVTVSYDKVKAKATSAIKQICASMNLTPEESKKVEEKLMQEFTKQETLLGVSGKINITNTDIISLICQNVTDLAPSIINETLTDLKVPQKNKQATINSITQIMGQITQQVEKIQAKASNSEKTTYNKAKAKTSSAIKQICASMNLSPEETKKVEEKLMQEFTKQEKLVGALVGDDVNDAELADLICQKVTEIAPSVLDAALIELGVEAKNRKVTISSMTKVMEKITQDVSNTQAAETKQTKGKSNYKKVKAKTASAIKEICASMHLNPQDTKKVEEKLMDEFAKQEVKLGLSGEIDMTDPMIVDIICQKVSEKIPSVLNETLSQLNISEKSKESTISSISKAVGKIKEEVKAEAVSADNKSNYKKMKVKTVSAIKEICESMNLNPEDSKKVEERLMQEFAKQEAELNISSVTDFKDSALLDLICQRIVEKAPEVLSETLSELNITNKTTQSTISSLTKAMKKIKEDTVKSGPEQQKDLKGTASYKKIKAKAASAIKQACSSMNLNPEQTKIVEDKLMKEFAQQEASLGISSTTDFTDAAIVDLICQKVTEKAPQILSETLSELDIPLKNKQETISSMTNAMKDIKENLKNEVVKPQGTASYNEVKAKASSAIKEICESMNLNAAETKVVEEKLMREFNNQEAELGITSGEGISDAALIEFVCKKVAEKAPVILSEALTELNVPQKNVKATISSIAQSMGKIAQEVVENEKAHKVSESYEQLKVKTVSKIEEICASMNLSPEETKMVEQRMMKEFEKQESLLCNGAVTDPNLMELICKKITENAPNVMSEVFTDLKVPQKDRQKMVASITNAIGGITQEALKVSVNPPSSAKKRDNVNYQKVKENTATAVKQICESMNLSPEEAVRVEERLMEEFINQENAMGILNSSENPAGTIVEIISQKVMEKAPEILGKVFAELNIPLKNEKATISSITKAMGQIAQEAVNEVPATSAVKNKVRYEKVKAQTAVEIQKVCESMNLSPAETKKVEEKLMKEFAKQEALFGVANSKGISDTALIDLICQKVTEQAPSVLNEVFSELNIPQKNRQATISSISQSIEKITQETAHPQSGSSIPSSQVKANYQKVKTQTASAVNQMCSSMNLSREEAKKVEEKLMEEFSKQEALLGVSSNIGLTDSELVDFICQKVTEKAPTILGKVFSELNVPQKTQASTIASITKKMGQIAKETVHTQNGYDLGSTSAPALKDTINYEKVKENAAQAVSQICSQMNLTKQEAAKMTEKIMQEFSEHKLSELIGRVEMEGLTSSTSIAELISQKVSEKAVSVIANVASELKLPKSCIPNISSIEKALSEIVHDEVIQSVVNQVAASSLLVVNPMKAKRQAPSIIQEVCSKMNSNSPDVTASLVEKIVLELINEEALEIMCNKNYEGESQPAALISARREAQKAKALSIIQKLSAGMDLPPDQIAEALEKVVKEFSKPEVFESICERRPSLISGDTRGAKKFIGTKLYRKDSVGEQVWEDAKMELRESASNEKVLEDCRKLLIEGYNDEFRGESDVKGPADMLKDHVEDQLTQELNEALLLEAIHLARVLNKMDVVRELESVFDNETSYETIVNDGEVAFILRQLVILKKLMAADKGGLISDTDEKMNLELNPGLIRDAQILTEFAFANDERERYFTPPCEDVVMLNAKYVKTLQVSHTTIYFPSYVVSSLLCSPTTTTNLCIIIITLSLCLSLSKGYTRCYVTPVSCLSCIPLQPTSLSYQCPQFSR